MRAAGNHRRVSTLTRPGLGLTAGIAVMTLAWPLPTVAQTNYYASTLTAQAPVGYWRLDETTGTTAVATVGGSGLNGGYRNFTTTTLDQVGPQPAAFPGFTAANKGKLFNGTTTATTDTTTRVFIADQDVLDITEGLTLSAWINPTAQNTDTRRIIAKWVGATPNQFAYQMAVRDGKFFLEVSESGTGTSTEWRLESSGTVTLNAWQHVAAVFVPGQAMRLYRNGILDSEKTTLVPASIASTTAPLYIGQGFSLDGRATFIGRIDEPAVFNMSLSGQAVRTQYTAGVFSGTSAWKTAGGGNWGSGYAGNWNSGTFNGSEVNAAPGTFAGVTNADTAIFGNAVTSGTATVTLDGAAPSLRRLEFTTADANYVIATGTGGSLTLASASGQPVIDVTTGSHEIATGIAGIAGLEKTGSGRLVLTGTSSYAGHTSLAAGTLIIDGAVPNTSGVSVAARAILGGSGSIAGSLSFTDGALLAFDPLSGGLQLPAADNVSFLDPTTFGVGSLRSPAGGAIDWSGVGSGTYTLLEGTTTDFSSLANFGPDSAFQLADGRSAYFANGSLQLVIVPEPQAWVLAGLGLAGGLAARRRRMGGRCPASGRRR